MQRADQTHLERIQRISSSIASLTPTPPQSSPSDTLVESMDDLETRFSAFEKADSFRWKDLEERLKKLAESEENEALETKLKLEELRSRVFDEIERSRNELAQIEKIGFEFEREILHEINEIENEVQEQCRIFEKEAYEEINKSKEIQNDIQKALCDSLSKTASERKHASELFSDYIKSKSREFSEELEVHRDSVKETESGLITLLQDFVLKVQNDVKQHHAHRLKNEEAIIGLLDSATAKLKEMYST